MHIGDRIRIRREELKMSQDELARRLGYRSRSSITKIEKDASGLPQTKIASIAKVLLTTPSYIMGWDEELESNTEEMAERHAEMIQDEDLNEIYVYFKALDQKKRKIVKDLIRSLSED